MRNGALDAIALHLHVQVKEQHMDCDVKFLAHELKVMDEQTARNRVFFVSAKEVLQLRTRQQNENQGKKVKREGR